MKLAPSITPLILFFNTIFISAVLAQESNSEIIGGVEIEGKYANHPLVIEARKAMKGILNEDPNLPRPTVAGECMVNYNPFVTGQMDKARMDAMRACQGLSLSVSKAENEDKVARNEATQAELSATTQKQYDNYSKDKAILIDQRDAAISNGTFYKKWREHIKGYKEDIERSHKNIRSTTNKSLKANYQNLVKAYHDLITAHEDNSEILAKAHPTLIKKYDLALTKLEAFKTSFENDANSSDTSNARVEYVRAYNDVFKYEKQYKDHSESISVAMDAVLNTEKEGLKLDQARRDEAQAALAILKKTLEDKKEAEKK